ncbi:MAG: MFS transporter [Nitrospinota bacterium]|nr:MFS transporter [Nitrospinota bacterium]
MLSNILPIWALFIGIAMITLGNGLQGTLLGVRASLEGFPTTTTGLVMSCYYAGFLLGSIYTPRFVVKVGHIRVFAALASLASAAVLIHSLFPDPLVWGLARLVAGTSFAGMFVVAESWLNGRSTNEIRGKILSIYMTIQYAGFIGGQFLLNLASPEGYSLFILISVLLSLALVPILITAVPAPVLQEPEHVGLRDLWRISPLGVFTGVNVGIAHGAIWGMGAVFAQGTGRTVTEISIFMATFVLGGFLFQWPLGIISDRMDRKRLIAIASWSAVLLATMCLFSVFELSTLIFVFGGISLPLYSLALAYTNDHLSQDQMVAASSSMVLIYGLGALLGPALASILMSVLGSWGFFLIQILAHMAVGLFALYYLAREPELRHADHSAFVSVPFRSSPMAAVLNPEAHESDLPSSPAERENEDQIIP